MVDANQGYDRAQAVEFARLVWDLDIRWFEEPVPLDQRRALDARRPLPDGPAGVRRPERDDAVAGSATSSSPGAIDVSNFDASWAGGPTIWRKAAGLAAAFGVQLGHHEEPQVSSHLLASVPDHTFVECFDEERDPFFWRLSDMSTRIAGGRYTLPERPGFGVELDWDYVRAHTVATRTSDRSTVA